ncbi:metallophosphoesterase [Allokutzneria sp. NRRL B-24872]|uniref:metallophosphoesterase family protein n=1 Tax=Allokutzneria sp. NRRL B-24872 TaxID=1137961 RepID=UPI000A384CC6|nr:metallophosphoesterase [Allokutzneria sp. NRRL B-24872]
MRVLMISDTHVPQRGRVVSEQVWRAVDEADLVIHAGDWVEESVLDAFSERAKVLVGVHGNNDDAGIRARLPEVAHVEVGSLRIGVVHETGDAKGREQRCDAHFPGVDVLVFGHSHIPWDTTTPGGIRLLNPGSPTDRRRQPAHTYLTATIGEHGLTDVRLHELPPR